VACFVRGEPRRVAVQSSDGQRMVRQNSGVFCAIRELPGVTRYCAGCQLRHTGGCSITWSTRWSNSSVHSTPRCRVTRWFALQYAICVLQLRLRAVIGPRLAGQFLIYSAIETRRKLPIRDRKRQVSVEEQERTGL